MKHLKKLVKYNIKFVPLLLALIISYMIYLDFSFENSLISYIDDNLDKPINKDIVDIDENVFFKFSNFLLKCSLAFILGVFISERKFILSGSI